MDANFINPVVGAVLDVLSTMAHLEPKAGNPVRKNRDEPVKGKNITGLMSMVGKKEIITDVGKRVAASIAITFTEPAILHIARKMMPMEISRVDGIVIDLAGEIANMVLGSAKKELEDSGYIFQLSLPTIIVGSDYLVAHKIRAPIIMLPFMMPEGDFYVEVGYEEA
jgi:chemotaxis protein CheX